VGKELTLLGLGTSLLASAEASYGRALGIKPACEEAGKREKLKHAGISLPLLLDLLVNTRERNGSLCGGERLGTARRVLVNYFK